MPKFKIYAKATTYYLTEVDVENAEDIVFNALDIEDFEELDEISWEIDEIEEVK